MKLNGFKKIKIITVGEALQNVTSLLHICIHRLTLVQQWPHIAKAEKVILIFLFSIIIKLTRSRPC